MSRFSGLLLCAVLFFTPAIIVAQESENAVEEPSVDSEVEASEAAEGLEAGEEQDASKADEESEGGGKEGEGEEGIEGDTPPAAVGATEEPQGNAATPEQPSAADTTPPSQQDEPVRTGTETTPEATPSEDGIRSKYPNLVEDRLKHPHPLFKFGGGSGRQMLFEVLFGVGYWVPNIVMGRVDLVGGWGAAPGLNWRMEGYVGYPLELFNFPTKIFMGRGEYVADDRPGRTDEDGKPIQLEQGYKVKLPMRFYVVPEVGYENFTQKLGAAGETKDSPNGRYNVLSGGVRLLARSHAKAAWQDVERKEAWTADSNVWGGLFARYYARVWGANKETTTGFSFGLQIPLFGPTMELYYAFTNDPNEFGMIGIHFSVVGGG